VNRFILLLILIISFSNATQPNNTSVTKLYVATFDRAPDSSGLDYWVNDSGLSLEEIAKSFFDQPETKYLYPDGFDDYDFILAIYKNLFKRIPDSAGGDYWQGELANGTVSKSGFILAVVNGAKDDDAKILANKTEVGLKFVGLGSIDIKLSKSIMESITSNRQTVTDSFNKISKINVNDDDTDIFRDDDTGLMWQDDIEAKSVIKPWVTQANYDLGNYHDASGDTANTYCDNLSLGGYSDWRLPTRDELSRLFGKKLNNTIFCNYWSSSSYKNCNSNYAWGLFFGDGMPSYMDKNDKRYVRCVRERQLIIKEDGTLIFSDSDIPRDEPWM